MNLQPNRLIHQEQSLDLLRSSNSGPFPFPALAATRLGEERGARYDNTLVDLEEAELCIREFASIMGLFATSDEPPKAA
tara:strand:+ start:1005 stop:1241 length:237 start_codon:yes stop_codon:yes gene_type:complete